MEEIEQIYHGFLYSSLILTTVSVSYLLLRNKNTSTPVFFCCHNNSICFLSSYAILTTVCFLSPSAVTPNISVSYLLLPSQQSMFPIYFCHHNNSICFLSSSAVVTTVSVFCLLLPYYQ